MEKLKETLIIVRGGGDIATGVIQKLVHAGFKVLVLETAQPLMIRRTVAFGSAVLKKRMQVEDLTAVCVEKEQIEDVWRDNHIPVVVDPTASLIEKLRPKIVVDAILAKKNLGTRKDMAPLTIALGPGFSAPDMVDVVVETMRGHRLGKLIFNGEPIPNTGTPGLIAGKGAERVIHAPVAGQIAHLTAIGDQVEVGQALFTIDDQPVYSPLAGTLRGLITDKMIVPKGLKVADVDPRAKVDCFTISDKARAIGGAVLEAVMWQGSEKNIF